MSISIPFSHFKKRNGTQVPFEPEKIFRAIIKAAEVVSRRDGSSVSQAAIHEVTEKVVGYLDDPTSEYYVFPDEQGERIPEIEDVQDLVEIVLAEAGFASVVATYKRYRKMRELARRRIKVRRGTNGNGSQDPTDTSLLLVESITEGVSHPWDRSRITRQLMQEAGLSAGTANAVAKTVENRIISSEFSTINTALIRELVNNELYERGCTEQLQDLNIYAVPRDFVETLIFRKSSENSNIVNNNPEAVNLSISELVLKQWALDTIYSVDVKRAHDTGALHVHDLGYPHRVYCSSHSLEYIKKYGLTGLENLNTESKPARSASVLTGHLNTFLASMQANYAGALGIGYINVLYAPLLEGKNDKELKQIAQELIFNGSQNAFSRGGQTLFLDFNIHSGVPSYLQGVPAVGPGGKYMLRLKDGSIAALEEQRLDETDVSGRHRLMQLVLKENGGKDRVVYREEREKEGGGGIGIDKALAKDLKARGEKMVTYGDYSEIARKFTLALLEVYEEGDRHGRIFEFPKCDFHVNEDSFNDPEENVILRRACELASRNGSTYFIFDRDEVTLSACCRLRTTIEDNYMLMHPESMRFCGFQNVTISLPQAAYRVRRAHGEVTLERYVEEVLKTMDLAMEAHLQKSGSISQMMSGPGRPLWQIGKPSNDGSPYVDLEEVTYIIGLLGLNDTVRFITGRELHESEEAVEFGLKVISSMYLKTKKLSEKHSLKVTLEETPAESAARRLAKTDMIYFKKEAAPIIKGSIEEDSIYYTNSVHVSPDAQVSLAERIRTQAKFHTLIESGAITHAFIGEERPDARTIYRLVRETFYKTQSAQLTISPEFTFCRDCKEISRGLTENCQACGSDNVFGETRVVGYFSKIENWNKSKREGELLDRQKGNYAVGKDGAGEAAGAMVTAGELEGGEE
ncbi:MAG: anaerobic ribonucleoside-triphosphate reductase [Gemmatimonadota bacterium]|nr:anaerobic ribonucleoside-triphosphate reductase [Gemmatimonadota bacterium]